MRRDFIIIFIIVTGGVLALNRWPNALPLDFGSVRGVVSRQTAPTPDSKRVEEAADPTSHHKRERSDRAKVASDQTTPHIEVLPTQAGAAICCPKPELPFPLPEAISKGSTTSEIRAAYGAPTFHIAGTSEGRVLEKYYYVNRDRSRLTVMTIENGLLTAATGLARPYFQLPREPDAVASQSTR